jgi:hypothetical protein
MCSACLLKATFEIQKVKQKEQLLKEVFTSITNRLNEIQERLRWINSSKQKSGSPQGEKELFHHRNSLNIEKNFCFEIKTEVFFFPF